MKQKMQQIECRHRQAKTPNCLNEWTFKIFDWKSFWIRLVCFCHLIDFDIAIVPCWMQPTQCVKREHSFGNCACLASQALARPEQDCQAAADDKLETSPPFCRPTTGSVNLSSMDHVDSMMKNYVERDDGHFWHSLYKLESVCPEWPRLILYRALQTMSPAGLDPHRFLTNGPNFG